MTSEKFLSLLQLVKSTGRNQWQAKCPAHDDQNPSLSVSLNCAKILIHCHAGCTVDEICDSLKITPADLFLEPRKVPATPVIKPPVLREEYPYQDEQGKTLFTVVRVEPGKNGNKDIFSKEKLQGIRRVPYQLPEIIKAEQVWIVEGERKADWLTKLGFIATCNPHGAEKWRDEYDQFFKGKDIVICPDNDEPGQRHCKQVVTHLKAVAARVQIVKVPAPHNDIVDYLKPIPEDKRQSAVFDLLMLAEEVKDTNALQVIDVADYINTEPAAPDCVLTDTFERGDKVAIIGQSKRRKTFFLMQGCLCLATGRKFMSWETPHKQRVLLVQYEIKASHAHRRIHRLARALGIKASDLRGQFFVISARGQKLTLDAVEREAIARKVAVIAFDPLFKMTEGDENKAQDLKPILSAFDRMAESTGAAVLYVHHDAKGTPGDRDIRDRGAGSNVIGRDYDACFTITEQKDDEDAVVVHTLLRNFPPQDPIALEWQDGAFRLSDLKPEVKTSGDRPSKYRDEILEIATAHPSMTYQEIADKVGCSKTLVFKNYPRKDGKA